MFQPLLRMAAVAGACLAMAIPAIAQGPGPNPGGPDQAVNSVSWSGDVDQAATVYFHGTRSWVDQVAGKPVTDIVSNFNPRLPTRHHVDVHLADIHGRGSVSLVQQPTADNNYTAAVRIRDPEPGKAHYHFRLVWNP